MSVIEATLGVDPELDVEPTFTLRAQDVFAPFAVREYAAMLRSCAAGLAGHDDEKAALVRAKAEGCETIAAEMIGWQTRNPGATKVPD